MKFIDSKGRLGGRFNLINVITVVVVLAALAAGAYKLFVVKESGVAATSGITITFEIDDVGQPSVDAVHLWETVYGWESQIMLGPVFHKRVKPHREPVATASGIILMAEVPGRYDLMLDVRARAAVGPRAISVSGREAKIGVELPISGRLFSFKATIVGLKETGE